jgi:hypothetical protein
MSGSLAVRPQVNIDNQILLDMTVASGTPEPVVDMLMRLEGSPLFGATAMTAGYRRHNPIRCSATG